MEQKEIARLFREEEPVKISAKNSSHGENDFREALFVEYGDEKIVIKLAGCQSTASGILRQFADLRISGGYQ